MAIYPQEKTPSARRTGRVLAGLSVAVALAGSLACEKKPPVRKFVPADRSANAIKPQPLAHAQALNRGEIFFHLLIPAPETLLAQVENELNMPALTGVHLNAEALRARIGELAGKKRERVAAHIDLTRPFGCAFADPGPYLNGVGSEWPGACVLGYTGGAKAFMKDMGKQGRKRRVKGHIGQYDLAGKSFYVDALGDDVVLSGTPDMFEKSKDYLAASFQGRAQQVKGVELTIYPAAVAQKYGAIAKSMMQAGLAGNPPMTAGDAKANAILAAIHRYGQRSQPRTFDALTSVSQLNFGLDIEGGRFRLVGQGLPDGAAAPLKAVLGSIAGKLDPAMVANLPSKPALLIGHRTDFSQFVEHIKADGSIDFLNEILQILSENNQDYGKELRGVGELLASRMEGSVGAGLYRRADGGGAMVTVGRLKPGETMRSLFEAMVARFPMSRFGPGATQHFNWGLEKKSLEIEGVACDRVFVEAGPELVKELDAEPDLAQLKKFLGGWKFALYSFQVGDLGVMVFAPNQEKDFLAQTLAAIAGSSGLEKDPGFPALQSKMAGNSFGMALDVATIKNWFALALDGADQASLRSAKLGSDLGDVLIRGRVESSGQFAMEFELSPGISRDVKQLIENQGTAQ